MINDGQITAPINAADPYKVLGVAASKGYDIGTICSNIHGKMNKWSIRKPMHVPNKLGLLTANDIRTWNCGLVTAESSTISGIINSVITGNCWRYLPPTGGMASPFRITDFDGYDHNTQPWCQIEVENDNKEWVRFGGIGKGVDTLKAYTSTLGDLLSDNNTYVGLLVYRLHPESGNVSNARLYVIGTVEDVETDWDKLVRMSHKVICDQIGGGDVYVIPAIGVLNGVLNVPCVATDGGSSPSVIRLFALPSDPLKVHIKSDAEQQYSPSDFGIGLEVISSSVTVRDNLPVSAYLIEYTCELRIWNTGTAAKDVTVTFEDNFGSATNQTGGMIQPDMSIKKTLSGSLARESIKDESELSASIRYELTISSQTPPACKETGTIYIENN